MMHNSINPAYSLAIRHQSHQVLHHREIDYENLEFDFNHQLSEDPPLFEEPPAEATFFGDQRYLQLNKSITLFDLLSLVCTKTNSWII